MHECVSSCLIIETARPYSYETHLHTNRGSACSPQDAKAYINYYLERGYSGIIVTDHFFNGNCAVSKELPWEERVRRYCLGYHEAKDEGDHLGLQVFFGIEYNFDCDEYLIYGLDEAWISNHPEIMKMSHHELFRTVDDAGGLMVQAHPFREREYISAIHPHPYDVHAVEVSNSGNSLASDERAYAYAKSYGLPMTSGSDIHFIGQLKEDVRGISFDHKLTGLQDFIDTIKSGTGYSLVGPKAIMIPCLTRPSLPVDEPKQQNDILYCQKPYL